MFASNRKDPLPERKLSKYEEKSLEWNERVGPFRIAVDSQPTFLNDVTLTYLKTLVTGKAKLAIADFLYLGRKYRDALNVFERNFVQSKTVVSAHLDKFNSASPVKLHNLGSIVHFACVISSLIGVFRLLSYANNLKETTILNQALYKSPSKYEGVLIILPGQA